MLLGVVVLLKVGFEDVYIITRVIASLKTCRSSGSVIAIFLFFCKNMRYLNERFF